MIRDFGNHVISQPLRLDGPRGWILRNVQFNSWTKERTYIYDSKKFPHLDIEITEKNKYSYFETNKKNHTYEVNVRRKFSLKEIVYVQFFKTFKKVFTSGTFLKELKFLENMEVLKETPTQQSPSFFQEQGPDDEKKSLDWFEKITKGRNVRWYSNYDAIVYPDENLPPLNLTDGTNNFIVYKVENKSGKLYVHFSKPIYLKKSETP